MDDPDHKNTQKEKNSVKFQDIKSTHKNQL